VFCTAFLNAELDPNLDPSALYAVALCPMLLPDLWREPRGPDPDGVRVLLLVGTGILDELGCLAFNSPGGPDTDTEVFLELGLELLVRLFFN